jgi:hypothetical protein
MAMGDGVLHIDGRFVDNLVNKESSAFSLNFGAKSSWKYGDDFKKRPKTTKQYYDNDLDIMRNVMYHEFGHHIHQMKYVTKNFTDDLGRVYGERGFTPKIENKVRAVIKNENLNNTKFGAIGNSEYGDTSPHEWFAEQFAVYSMGKLDKVHPAFIKLIKEIEDEVGN